VSSACAGAGGPVPRSGTLLCGAGASLLRRRSASYGRGVNGAWLGVGSGGVGRREAPGTHAEADGSKSRTRGGRGGVRNERRGAPLGRSCGPEPTRARAMCDEVALSRSELASGGHPGVWRWRDAATGSARLRGTSAWTRGLRQGDISLLMRRCRVARSARESGAVQLQRRIITKAYVALPQGGANAAAQQRSDGVSEWVRSGRSRHDAAASPNAARSAQWASAGMMAAGARSGERRRRDRLRAQRVFWRGSCRGIRRYQTGLTNRRRPHIQFQTALAKTYRLVHCNTRPMHVNPSPGNKPHWEDPHLKNMHQRECYSFPGVFRVLPD